MDDQKPPINGLLLTGGGARAAYQVGVLEAIVDIRRECSARHPRNPFKVITGTSAGAINAAALACGADNFELAVRNVADVWRNFRSDQVYRSDSLGIIRTGASWLTLLSLGWLLTRKRRANPRSLLDNAPLLELLRSLVPLERLPHLVARGHLRALGVTASSYSSGEHATFYEGAESIAPWSRSQRFGMRAGITHAHLMASSAIPFIFPAWPLPVDERVDYFGDGSMRQSAPIAAPIHLGAERILAIGAGRMHEPRQGSRTGRASSYPTVAQIAGHTLSNIFLDALAVDVERVRRINHTVGLVPPGARKTSTLKHIELLEISPSKRIDEIAAQHIGDMPRPVRALLSAVGVTSDKSDYQGAALASYLLFEADFTRELMALGRADAERKRNRICAFFGWSDPREPVVTATQPLVERRHDPLRLR